MDAVCIVCHRRLGANPQKLGERTYCDEHIHRVAEDRPNFWRVTTTQLVVLPLLLVAVLVVSEIIGVSIGDRLRIPVSMGLAILPGLEWLTLIYWQERANGSVTQFLPTVVVLGALVASALGVPFLQQVVGINSWLPNSSLTVRFLGNLLLVAPTHMFLVYAVVRYTVLRTQAIQRRVDGILFTVAAAVGYASMLNIQTVIQQGGFEPASGIFRIIGDVVGHAGAAAVLGYYLGRYRLEHMPVYFLPAGLLLSIFVDGLMVYSRVEINRTSLGLEQDAFSPWPGLVFSFFLASLAFLATFGLLKRVNTRTQAQLETQLETVGI